MAHAWSIAQREYDRQLSRRGKLHAFETLTPAATALVVIDMVPFFAEANPYCRAIIPTINALADALRTAGGTVAWVLPSSEQPHPELAQEFLGAEVAELFRTSGGQGPLPGRLCGELDAQPHDLFAEKSAHSAFFPGRCALPDLLRPRGIDTVIIVGTVTNVCCESSARDAHTSGFRVIMAADANAARTDAEHNAALHTIYRTFGDVRPAAEILELIGAAAL